MKKMIICLTALVAVFVLAACGSNDSAQSDEAAQPSTAKRAVDRTQQVAQDVGGPKAGLDPVCSMALDENAVVATYEGKEYGFCSQRCADTAMADPGKYLVAVNTESDEHEGHDH